MENNGLAYLPLLMLAISIPLALGTIEPNHFYGFRYPASMESDAAWYKANSAGGWAMLVTSSAAFAANYTFVRRIKQPRSKLALYLASVFVPLGLSIAASKAALS